MVEPYHWYGTSTGTAAQQSTGTALQVVLFYLVLYLYTWALASSPRPTIFFFFTLTPLCPPRFALEARPPLPLFYNSPMPHPCPPPQIFPPTGGGEAPGSIYQW
jgi:hypothetical protein